MSDELLARLLQYALLEIGLLAEELVVHDDGEQVVAVGEPVVSRLVDEMLSSRIALLDKKKAGENVPGTWKPS